MNATYLYSMSDCMCVHLSVGMKMKHFELLLYSMDVGVCVCWCVSMWMYVWMFLFVGTFLLFFFYCKALWIAQVWGVCYANTWICSAHFIHLIAFCVCVCVIKDESIQVCLCFLGYYRRRQTIRLLKCILLVRAFLSVSLHVNVQIYVL